MYFSLSVPGGKMVNRPAVASAGREVEGADGSFSLAFLLLARGEGGGNVVVLTVVCAAVLLGASWLGLEPGAGCRGCELPG